MRFIQHMLPMTLCGALAACGGASSGAEAWEEVVPVAEEPVPAESALDATTTCPFPLADVVRAEVGIRYVVEGLPSASVLVAPSAGEATEAIAFTYEVRDERGREAGTTSYVCDDGGLHLLSTGTETHHVAFEPPLPALYLENRVGDVSGTAVLTTASGVTALPYTFEFAVSESPTAGPMESEPGRRMRTTSVLLLGGTNDQTRVESESLWLIAPTVIGILERAQTTTHSDGAEERREERAGSLRR